MTSNAYGRLSVGNSMGNQGQNTGYSGYGAHGNHSNNHGTHNSHSNHPPGSNTHAPANEVTFPNNVAPEDYLGKLSCPANCLRKTKREQPVEGRGISAS